MAASAQIRQGAPSAAPVFGSVRGTSGIITTVGPTTTVGVRVGVGEACSSGVPGVCVGVAVVFGFRRSGVSVSVGVAVALGVSVVPGRSGFDGVEDGVLVTTAGVGVLLAAVGVGVSGFSGFSGVGGVGVLLAVAVGVLVATVWPNGR